MNSITHEWVQTIVRISFGRYAFSREYFEGVRLLRKIERWLHANHLQRSMFDAYGFPKFPSGNYDGIDDDSLFNLTLQRIDPTNGFIADQEMFHRLSFVEGADSFVGDVLSSSTSAGAFGVDNQGNVVNAEGLRLQAYPFAGSGLFYVPVHHHGNQNRSLEEVEVVARIVEGLLESHVSWTDADGTNHRLDQGDVLVIAPYNAQVAALTERLPHLRIGTVDKFQGQEAPVVIYSMASSSVEDAPRGMSFRGDAS